MVWTSDTGCGSCVCVLTDTGCGSYVCVCVRACGCVVGQSSFENASSVGAGRRPSTSSTVGPPAFFFASTCYVAKLDKDQTFKLIVSAAGVVGEVVFAHPRQCASLREPAATGQAGVDLGSVAAP
eukprot:3136245-Rhodomonas_salina.1